MPRQPHTREEVGQAFKRFPKARITALGSAECEMLESVLRRRVSVGKSGRLTAVRTLLNLAESSSTTAIVFLKGGVPRDIVGHCEPRDVDAAYVGTDRAKVLAALKDNYGKELALGQKVAVIGLLGVGIGDDAFDISQLHLHKCGADCTANSLLIHASTRTLIDPFGSGEQDARDKVFRIPCSDKLEWATSVRQPLWRMLKFRARGFTTPPEEMAFVYKHFVEHEDTHDDVVWKDGAVKVLQGATHDTLQIASQDIARLKSQGLLQFGFSEFLLLLIKHGTLTLPKLTTHYISSNKRTPSKKAKSTHGKQKKQR